jgi:hypothetical protein
VDVFLKKDWNICNAGTLLKARITVRLYIENVTSPLFLDSIEFLHIPVATIVWREII